MSSIPIVDMIAMEDKYFPRIVNLGVNDSQIFFSHSFDLNQIHLSKSKLFFASNLKSMVHFSVGRVEGL